MYKPLPKEVTVKKSLINGLGLFAEEDIKKGTQLGISHVSDIRFENGYIRTPLGAFVNHSNEPNCEFIKETEFIYLEVIKNTPVGTELTAKYWLYDVG